MSGYMPIYLSSSVSPHPSTLFPSHFFLAWFGESDSGCQGACPALERLTLAGGSLGEWDGHFGSLQQFV